MSGGCKCGNPPLGEPTALHPQNKLDLRGQFDAGRERGKGKEERDGRDGRKHPSSKINICLQPWLLLRQYVAVTLETRLGRV